MRVVIQKVKNASVTVNKKVVGKINNGLLLLVGYENGDSANDILWIINKIKIGRQYNNSYGSYYKNFYKIIRFKCNLSK